MKHLKQSIARRANVEDDCAGHFFEQRFYSGALLTEEALIAAMAYVDLNPVRAELAEHIEEIRDTSISDRLQANSAKALADYLRPVMAGIDSRSTDSVPAPGAGVAVGSHSPGRAETFAPEGVTDETRPDVDPNTGMREQPCPVGTEQPDAGPSEATRGDEDEAVAEGEPAAEDEPARPR